MQRLCSLLPSHASRSASRSFVPRCLSTTSTASPSNTPSQHTQTVPEYHTQRRAVYRLPFYGAPHTQLEQLSAEQLRATLRAYGALVRPRDDERTLLQRLCALTNAQYRPAQLCIEGVVVSNRMDKSVVVAARRMCFSDKLQKRYHKTRRFMAHDEFNLCREGDRVLIRSCRLLSKRKSHVVVLNYGDATRPGVDQRSIQTV